MDKNSALLMERYPEIAFLFHCVPFTPFTLFTDLEGRNNAKRGDFVLYSKKRYKQRIFENADILYVFGLGLGASYAEYQPWLEAKQGRRLIYLEEDLAVFDAFLRQDSELVTALLQNPKVYLYFIPDKKAWGNLIEELAQKFVSDKIACTILDSYRPLHGKRYKRLELKLLRATVSLHALICESLYAQKIFANLYPNLQRIPEAFYANHFQGKFAKIPAVICGAGPSLNGAIPFLNELEHRALIIAGGSALTALSRHGIEPHLGIALDPNREEYDRLLPSTAFQVPLLYANRLFPKVFDIIGGPIGYLRSDTGGLAESWIEEALCIEGEPIGRDLGREAFSVTTLAVALAYVMGCDPIILVGVDLAYTGKHRYAEGVLETANHLKDLPSDPRLIERPLKRKDREGNTIHTALKWVMESASIGAFAKKHRTAEFINATDGGIGFPHIPYMPLKAVIKEKCHHHYDLRGKIHMEIEKARIFSIDALQLKSLFAELQESLKKMLAIADEMLVEKTGRRIALEFDFMEEAAFDCFLQALGPSLDRLLERYFPKEEHETIKWKEIRRIIRQYLDILQGNKNDSYQKEVFQEVQKK